MFSSTFEIRKGDIVAVTGGGGKTSLMFRLAEELSEFGRVLVTTTTKIYTPPEDRYEKLIIGEKVFFGRSKNIFIVGREGTHGKIHGLSYDEVTDIASKYDYVLIEADGAKEKQMKGWKKDEPCIPPFATKVIGVASIKSLGTEATEGNIHRLNIFLKMMEMNGGEEVTLKTLEKYFRRGEFFKGSRGEEIFYLNGVEDTEEIEVALRLGNEMEGFYFGSVMEGSIVKHKKVDAVVMASGYSKRFGGEDKLLKKIEGVSVIEYLFKNLKTLPFKSVNVVGRNVQVERLSRKYGYRYIENKKSDLGQSESIKAGMKVCFGEGMMFFTGDQPLLKTESILKLLQAFQEEDLITRPVFEGVPCSPVIFPARYREELLKLEGDNGGRKVIRGAKIIKEVEFIDGNEFKDIDTEKDFRVIEGIMRDKERKK